MIVILIVVENLSCEGGNTPLLVLIELSKVYIRSFYIISYWTECKYWGSGVCATMLLFLPDGIVPGANIGRGTGLSPKFWSPAGFNSFTSHLTSIKSSIDHTLVWNEILFKSINIVNELGNYKYPSELVWI